VLKNEISDVKIILLFTIFKAFVWYVGITLKVLKFKVTLHPSHYFVWQTVVLLIHFPLTSQKKLCKIHGTEEIVSSCLQKNVLIHEKLSGTSQQCNCFSLGREENLLRGENTFAHK